MACVYIPSLMQKLTNGTSQIEVDGQNVREVIDNLDSKFPGIKDKLVENKGPIPKLKSSISVAVDGQITNVGLIQKIPSNCEIHFLPAIAGGS
ncbi:MAG: MoaD/ThiS family protein [Dehalococcoidia bacterium]